MQLSGGSFFFLQMGALLSAKYIPVSILLTSSWRGVFVLVKPGTQLPIWDSPSGGGTVLVNFLCGRNCPSKFPPWKGEDMSWGRRYCTEITQYIPGEDFVMRRGGRVL